MRGIQAPEMTQRYIRLPLFKMPHLQATVPPTSMPREFDPDSDASLNAQTQVWNKSKLLDTKATGTDCTSLSGEARSQEPCVTALRAHGNIAPSLAFLHLLCHTNNLRNRPETRIPLLPHNLHLHLLLHFLLSPIYISYSSKPTLFNRLLQ